MKGGCLSSLQACTAGFCCLGEIPLYNTAQWCAETLRLPLMAALCDNFVMLALAQVILLQNMLEQSEQHSV